jgi:hypothetical protein
MTTQVPRAGPEAIPDVYAASVRDVCGFAAQFSRAGQDR